MPNESLSAGRDAAPPQVALAPLGQDGLLIRFADLPLEAATAAVQTLAQELEAAVAGPPGAPALLSAVTEIAGGLASVLLRFDPARTTRAELAQALAPWLARDWAALPPPAPRRRWLVPAAFGGAFGPQLAEAARAAGLAEAEAIAQLAETELRVLAIGFAPGQPYLGFLPPAWDLPRQQALTPRVPPGAIAVAVRQLVLFANGSKTGWQWLGQAAFRPFEPARAEPLPLAQGDALRFVPVSAGELEALARNNADGMGGARCEVPA